MGTVRAQVVSLKVAALSFYIVGRRLFAVCRIKYQHVFGIVVRSPL